jgi:hypothetical protein
MTEQRAESEYRTWLSLGESGRVVTLSVTETTPPPNGTVIYLGQRFAIAGVERDAEGKIESRSLLSLATSSGRTWSRSAVAGFEYLLLVSWEGPDVTASLPDEVRDTLGSLPDKVRNDLGFSTRTENTSFDQSDWISAAVTVDDQVLVVNGGSIRFLAFIRPVLEIDLSGFPGEFVAIDSARVVVAHAPTISELKALLGDHWNSQLSILRSPSVATS